MSLQTLASGMIIPAIPLTNNGLTYASYLIDAAGEKVEQIIEVPETGTVDAVQFRVGTVTTSQTLRVGLQTLTAGDASGSLYGGSAVGTQASPATDTAYTVVLGTAASVVKGDIIAVVIEFDATVGSVNISLHNCDRDVRFPYCGLYTASWARSNNLRPTVALRYNDGTYKYSAGAYPTDNYYGVGFNSSSTPDERALRFTLPFPCRVSEFWTLLDYDNACDVVLYEGTTALTTVSFDSAIRSGTNQGIIFRKFVTSQTLSANTEYYLAVKPTTTSNVTLYEWSVPSAAVMDAMSGGQPFHLATRTDAGAWSTTTTRRPMLGICIDQFDDGAGGGGGGGPVIGGRVVL